MTTFFAEGGADVLFSEEDLGNLVVESLKKSGRDLSAVVVVSTDKTRKEGKAGVITQELWKRHMNGLTIADIYIALGSHKVHTPDDQSDMFGDIPPNFFNWHDWRRTTQIGKVPDELVREFEKPVKPRRTN